jgi:hypothetical protein
MRKPTPVMISIISELSGSTRKENETEKFPVVIQSNAVYVSERSESGVFRRLRNRTADKTKEKRTTPQAIRETKLFESFLLANPMRINPSRGASGIRPIKSGITILIYSVR